MVKFPAADGNSRVRKSARVASPVMEDVAEETLFELMYLTLQEWFSSLQQTGTPGHQKSARVASPVMEDVAEETLIELMYTCNITGAV